MHDLSCVVHLHSTHSDGTGTVPEIARAAARARADVVLLTDHDTLAARRLGEEGWYGDVLLLAGEEISPLGRDHYLTFGLDEHVRHRGLDACAIATAVRDAGGFGFAAHPFSEGSARFRRPGMPFGGLDCDALHGIELWNFANDTGEQITGIVGLIRLLATPQRVLDHPPERNMRAWDELCRQRRIVAIGGLDAHQYGKRVGPFVPVRVMAYHRTFRLIRTHVLCEEPPARELERDRELVFDALRAGRCYIAVDSRRPGARLPLRGGRRPDGRRGAGRPPDAPRARPAPGTAASAARRPRDRGGGRDDAGRRRRGAGRLPRRGAPHGQGPRAHLDHLEPRIPSLTMRLGENLEVLRRRDFRLLFLGQGVSVLGDRMVVVALAFAVIELGGSVSEVGLVLAAGWLPLVGTVLAGGVVADRSSRRAVMLTADLARIASQGTMAVLVITGAGEVWMLAALAGVTGAGTGFFDPAVTGLLPEVVPPDELQPANALRSTAVSGSEIAGPALAGVIVAAAGAGWAIAVDAATFAASAVCLATLRPPARTLPERASFFDDLRAGWIAFRTRRWVWSFVGYFAVGEHGVGRVERARAERGRARARRRRGVGHDPRLPGRRRARLAA